MGFYTDVKFTSFLESSKILEKKFFNFSREDETGKSSVWTCSRILYFIRGMGDLLRMAGSFFPR